MLAVLWWLVVPERPKPVCVPVSREAWERELPDGAPDDCGYRWTCPWGCDCPVSKQARQNAEQAGAPGLANPGFYLHRPLGPGLLSTPPPCPICEGRAQEYARAGKPFVFGEVSYRKRDGAIYCFKCGESTYAMSDDSAMRYDERFHWPRKAAA